MTSMEVVPAAALDSALTVIEGQKHLIRAMAEELGGLVAVIETAMPLLAPAVDAGAIPEAVERGRQWLLEIAAMQGHAVAVADEIQALRDGMRMLQERGHLPTVGESDGEEPS